MAALSSVLAFLWRWKWTAGLFGVFGVIVGGAAAVQEGVGDPLNGAQGPIIIRETETATPAVTTTTTVTATTITTEPGTTVTEPGSTTTETLVVPTFGPTSSPTNSPSSTPTSSPTLTRTPRNSANGLDEWCLIERDGQLIKQPCPKETP